MKYIVTLNGKKYEVEVEKGKAKEVYLGLADEVSTAPPQAQAPQPQVAQAPVASVAPSGSGEPVQAPMTGNIVQIKCSVDQSVKKGEVLFILEAMKMENEIVAPKDGKITGIQIAKGASVDTGAVLCTIG